MLSDPLSVIRAMAYIGWSDKEMSDAERRVIEGQIVALGLSGEQLATARGYLDVVPALADVTLEDPDEARYALTMAVIVACADRHNNAIEVLDVLRLGEQLRVPDHEIRRISQAVEKIYGA